MAHPVGAVTGLRFAKDTTAYAKVSDERSVNLVWRKLNWSLCSGAFV